MKRTGKWKGLLSVITAMVLVLAMGIGAAAAGSGSIVVSNPQSSAEYTVYQIFEATVSEDGSNIAYTATKTQAEWFAEQENCPFEFTPNTQGTCNVSIADGVSDSDIIAFLWEVYEAAVSDEIITAYTEDSDGVTYTTDEDEGTLTISGLPYGYYFVASATGALVSITSVTPEAEIVDKTNLGQPSLEKSVSTSPQGPWSGSIEVEVGDTVYFQSTVTTTDYARNYVMHDTMSSGLTLVVDSIRVTVDGVELTEGEEYTVTTQCSDGCTFEITMDNDYLATLSGGTQIVVQYAAVVNEKAVVGGSGNPNTIRLEYSDPYYWAFLQEDVPGTPIEARAVAYIPSPDSDDGGGSDDDDPEPEDEDEPDEETEESEEESADEVESSAEEAASLIAYAEGAAGGEEGAETLAQTGQLNWPVPVLAVCGMMLMALGFSIDRKSRVQEEAEAGAAGQHTDEE